MAPSIASSVSSMIPLLDNWTLQGSLRLESGNDGFRRLPIEDAAPDILRAGKLATLEDDDREPGLGKRLLAAEMPAGPAPTTMASNRSSSKPHSSSLSIAPLVSWQDTHDNARFRRRHSHNRITFRLY